MLIPKYFISLIITFSIGCSAYAQQALYIRPGATLLFPVHHQLVNDHNSSLKHNRPALFFGAGFDVLYRLNDKTDIFAGFQRSNIGFGYQIDGRKSSTKTRQYEFPLGLEWMIKNIWFYALDERPKIFGSNSRMNGSYYLALFRIKGLTGISLSSIEPQGFNETAKSGLLDYTINANALRHNNFSVFGGITLQFYNRKRDKIHFTLLYNQGLSKMMELVLVEKEGGISYTTHVGSRGSYLSTQLKLPLRLATIDTQ